MDNLNFSAFDENYAVVCENIEKSAQKVGKSFNDITLLAATKTVPIEMINYSHNQGIKVMGENRVQEFLSKEESLSKTLRRQLIGSLQTNKVKQIVGKVELIQSVDSLHLAKEISKQSIKNNLISNILIEINIGNEEAKGGINENNLNELLSEISTLDGLRVQGLMTLGPIFENIEQKSKYFDKMFKLFIDNKGKNVDNINMNILSMGMSDDYSLAIECGATMVRVGSALYGKRIYK